MNNLFEGYGLFSIVVNLFRYIFISQSERKTNEELKKSTFDPETNTYLDSRCVRRKIEDNSYLFKSRNAYGEIVVRYEDGTIENLTQKKYDNAPGTVTQLTGWANHEKAHYYTKAIGYRYKDRVSGDIYVIRNFEINNEMFMFYMDAENANIIRPTDGQIKLEEEAKKQGKHYYDEAFFNNLIAELNNREISYLFKDDKAIFFRNDQNSIDFSDSLIAKIVYHRKKE